MYLIFGAAFHKGFEDRIGLHQSQRIFAGVGGNPCDAIGQRAHLVLGDLAFAWLAIEGEDIGGRRFVKPRKPAQQFAALIKNGAFQPVLARLAAIEG